MIKIISILCLALFLLLVGPFATIWAANTLFPALHIEYSMTNWLAVIVLGAFFRANVSVKK
jgi:hypothetical protein